MHHRSQRLRHLLNWMNLSTPAGLLVARAGGARLRRSPDGLFLAEGYRFRYPVAGAFTVGDVVTTAHTFDDLESRTPGVLGHERRHAWQWAATGPWFLPAYLLGSAWSWWRTGDPALHNPLERHAGLVTGGYLHSEGQPIQRRVRRSSGRRGGGPSGSPDGAGAGGAAASRAWARARGPRAGRSGR